MPWRRHAVWPGDTASIRRCAVLNGAASVPGAESDPDGEATRWQPDAEAVPGAAAIAAPASRTRQPMDLRRGRV